MRNILPLSALIFVVACTPPTEHASSEPHELTPEAPHSIDALLGRWQEVQDSGRTVFHEQWEKEANGSLKGLGYVMSGMDTVFIEHLAILGTDTGTFYSATIQSQNNGQAVLFQLVHEQDSLIFTNPAHDFPDSIVYTPLLNGTMNVLVSGTGNGARRSEHYHLSRPSSDSVSTGQ